MDKHNLKHVAKLYRDSVRDLCWEYNHNFLGDGSDDSFRSYLERKYDESKKELSDLLDKRASESEIQITKAGLFVLAVGLLTFGRLDVVYDIIDGIPSRQAGVSRLSLGIKALLPLPEEMSPLKDANAVKRWIQENYSKMKWDGATERYIFS